MNHGFDRNAERLESQGKEVRVLQTTMMGSSTRVRRNRLGRSTYLVEGFSRAKNFSSSASRKRPPSAPAGRRPHTIMSYAPLSYRRDHLRHWCASPLQDTERNEPNGRAQSPNYRQAQALRPSPPRPRSQNDARVYRRTHSPYPSRNLFRPVRPRSAAGHIRRRDVSPPRHRRQRPGSLSPRSDSAVSEDEGDFSMRRSGRPHTAGDGRRRRRPGSERPDEVQDKRPGTAGDDRRGRRRSQSEGIRHTRSSDTTPAPSRSNDTPMHGSFPVNAWDDSTDDDSPSEKNRTRHLSLRQPKKVDDDDESLRRVRRSSFDDMSQGPRKARRQSFGDMSGILAEPTPEATLEREKAKRQAKANARRQSLALDFKHLTGNQAEAVLPRRRGSVMPVQPGSPAEINSPMVRSHNEMMANAGLAVMLREQVRLISYDDVGWTAFAFFCL